jgi:ABC-2 type transport system ATP-binding protein
MSAAWAPVVSARRLRKKFASNEALIDFTLDVPSGAVFALVGPNGAGKTTALKTILNVVRRDSGTSTVLGVDSTRIGVAELQRVGYVSEEQNLPDWMTAISLDT